jgi:hypothetical protein
VGAINIHSIYGLFRGPFRTKRMGKVWDSFGLSEGHIGARRGRASHNWLLLPEHPRVVLLNIAPIEGPDMLSVVGDAPLATVQGQPIRRRFQ